MNHTELVERWDRQQAAYIAHREGRFEAIQNSTPRVTGGLGIQLSRADSRGRTT